LRECRFGKFVSATSGTPPESRETKAAQSLSSGGNPCRAPPAARDEAKDFLVNLIEPESGDAHFFVQVKATRSGYTGTGPDEKPNVNVTRADIAKLKKVPAPTSVVGIDIVKECGFLIAITGETTGSLSGITTRFRINCRVIKALWNEVDTCWRARKMLAAASAFSP
jgi:hypothetical protein